MLCLMHPRMHFIILAARVHCRLLLSLLSIDPPDPFMQDCFQANILSSVYLFPEIDDLTGDYKSYAEE